MANIAERHAPRRSLLAFASDPFRFRAPGVIDRRDLTDELKRDLGLLDGHRAVGGVRWDGGRR